MIYKSIIKNRERKLLSNLFFLSLPPEEILALTLVIDKRNLPFGGMKIGM
jgi:hypothetical protein